MSTPANEVKHTPGPWAIEPIEDSQVGAHWITYLAPGGFKIAKVAMFDAPNEANAELIANAPDLLLRNQQLEEQNARQPFYYEWGNEPAGEVSVAHYENEVLKELGTMPKKYVEMLGLKFNNPHA